jgi:CcmD family protein
MNSVLNNILLQAQVATEQASTHKFEVTVAVIALIFVAIVGYLISIDRKLSKLEKK